MLRKRKEAERAREKPFESCDLQAGIHTEAKEPVTHDQASCVADTIVFFILKFSLLYVILMISFCCTSSLLVLYKME